MLVESETSNAVGVNFVLDLQYQSKSIKILFKSAKSEIKEKLPEILKPGSLNEEYFTSVINDAIVKLNESKEEVGLPRIFNPRLILGIYENNVKKYGRYFDILGYTPEELIKNLESKFTENMSWNNYGKWHVDHIIPISSFKFESIHDVEFKKCWSLDNLQPLWGSENIIKSNKLFD